MEEYNMFKGRTIFNIVKMSILTKACTDLMLILPKFQWHITQKKNSLNYFKSNEVPNKASLNKQNKVEAALSNFQSNTKSLQLKYHEFALTL